jgi:hypothetical protein
VGVPDVEMKWKKATPLSRKRAVLEALLEVTVLPTTRGRPRGWQPGQPYFREESIGLRWLVPE